MGNRWGQIAEHLPGRTENSVKNRFFSALRRVQRAVGNGCSTDAAAGLLFSYAKRDAMASTSSTSPAPSSAGAPSSLPAPALPLPPSQQAQALPQPQPPLAQPMMMVPVPGMPGVHMPVAMMTPQQMAAMGASGGMGPLGMGMALGMQVPGGMGGLGGNSGASLSSSMASMLGKKPGGGGVQYEDPLIRLVGERKKAGQSLQGSYGESYRGVPKKRLPPSCSLLPTASGLSPLSFPIIPSASFPLYPRRAACGGPLLGAAAAQRTEAAQRDRAHYARNAHVFVVVQQQYAR